MITTSTLMLWAALSIVILVGAFYAVSDRPRYR